MRKFTSFSNGLSCLLALALLLAGFTPAQAGTTTFKSNVRVTGTLTVTGSPTFSSGTITANGDTLTLPDVGNASFVMTAGNQTIAGTKTFSTPPTITGGLTAANIASGSAKRQVQTVQLAPVTGACADSTVYRGIISFKRAGTVTGISYGAAVALNSATIGQSATLTATSADLALTADQVIACEYNAGSQDTDAQQVYVTVEFEPTDF